MASRSERRAALAARQAHPSVEEMARMADVVEQLHVPAEPLRADDYIFRAEAPTTEDPMTKIRFTSVRLHKTVPRLDAGRGQATQDTTHFGADGGVVIEYDPSTGLVTLSKGTACVSIPLAGVERFGPTIEQAKAHAAALADIETAKRRAIEAASLAEQTA